MSPKFKTWNHPFLNVLADEAGNSFDNGWRQGRALKEGQLKPVNAPSLEKVQIPKDLKGAVEALDILRRMQGKVMNAVSQSGDWGPLAVVIRKLLPHEYAMSSSSDELGLVHPHRGDFQTMGKVPSIDRILDHTSAGLICLALIRCGVKFGLVYDIDSRNQLCIKMFVELQG